MSDQFRSRVHDFVHDVTGFDAGLGLRFSRTAKDLVEAELLVDSRHLQLHGIVHGGVYCTLVETTCSVGAALAAGEDRVVVGLENHTSFLRGCRFGERLSVRAVPLSTGRRTQVWEATIVDSQGRRVARGQVRLISLAPEPPPNEG